MSSCLAATCTRAAFMEYLLYAGNRAGHQEIGQEQAQCVGSTMKEVSLLEQGKRHDSPLSVIDFIIRFLLFSLSQVLGIHTHF